MDVFRLLAIIAVIAIHTQPFGGGTEEIPGGFISINMLIDQLARFAVPFFFVISGYFWGNKTRNSASPIPASASMGKKILTIFLAWSAIYALPVDFGSFAEYGPLGPIKADYWNLVGLVHHPLTLIMQGTSDHLWFLVGLLCSLLISAPLVKNKQIKTLIAVSVALYIFGLLAKSYSATPLGIHINFNTRNGPFFGTIFFVSGYLLSSLKPTPKWLAAGLLILGIGYLLHFLELYLLWNWYGTSPHQEYVIGTYFMGVGAAIAALSNHRLLQNDVLSGLGKFTLGIYAIHVMFVEMLHPIGKLTTSPFWELGYVILVFLLSVAAVMFLSKHKMARKIVV